ncbi:MAG: arginine--tRNA ligase [Holosporales bacterium]|jgi:arginyl-tRNA synthetase|nr:arginine--tRNA ligase [Holosporales bacterium]
MVRHCILDALQQYIDVCDLNVDIDTEIAVEPPHCKNHGDLYTNAAMVFAKKLKKPPKEIANIICEHLLKIPEITEASIANPGFINIRVNTDTWKLKIGEIIRLGCDYSYTNIYQGTTVNVEFVSANPTGPLHTGHARNAVLGSVIANLLEKVGYIVTREFYINDLGSQIKSLAKSVYLRYQENFGITVPDSTFTDDMYCGEYIRDITAALAEIHHDAFIGKDEAEWLRPFCEFSIARMMDGIKNDLAIVGVTMDLYTSEASLHARGMMDRALTKLMENGDVYGGVLPRPKGISNDEEWEELPQTLFNSTKYGDDVDRVIQKSDGTWTYFAGDLAYHLDKIERGYQRLVTILGADHNGYIKRLLAAVNAMSHGKVQFDVRLYQLVNFLENGVPVRMSKRSGNFITLRDVVDRVGKDITRYMMISRHHDVMIDFDFAKVVECTIDNPLFYVQYAYARICSVFRHYESVFGKVDEAELAICDTACITDELEMELVKALAYWPEQVKAAAIALESHRIPKHLQDIAHNFHALWNKGKTNAELRFIDRNDKESTKARLALLLATKFVIEDGFKIIGVTPMQEMR